MRARLDTLIALIKVDRAIARYRTRDDASSFKETDHPRDEGGEFKSGAGSSSFKKTETSEWKFGSGSIPTNAERETPYPSPEAKDNPLIVLTPMRSEVFDDKKRHQTMEVPLKELASWQSHVDVNKLRPLTEDAPPIHVYKINGKYIIANGNHRATSAFLAGKTHIEAKVADMDNASNKKYWKRGNSPEGGFKGSK